MPVYGTHSSAKEKKAQLLVINELINREVFAFKPGRLHPSFQSLPSTIYMHYTEQKLVQWMKGYVKRKT